MKKNNADERKPQAIDYNSVDMKMKNDHAYLGLLLHDNYRGDDRQILVISNGSGSIVDIQEVHPEQKSINFSYPITVLSSNEDESSYIASGFYAYGLRHTLVQNHRDVTFDTFYDRSFGYSRYSMSAYEKTEIMQRAMEELDDNAKKSLNTSDMKSYLEETLVEYYNDRAPFKKDIDNTKNQFEAIGLMQAEMRSVFDDSSENSFTSVMRAKAIDVSIQQSDLLANNIRSNIDDGSKTMFERVCNEHLLNTVVLKQRYYENSKTLLENNREDVIRSGLIHDVGQTSEVSYHKINNVLSGLHQQIEKDLANGTPNPIVEARLNYANRLFDVAQTHPFYLNSSHSKYLDSEIADTLKQYNPNFDTHRLYKDNVLKSSMISVRSNLTASDPNKVYDELLMQRGELHYRLMPNTNVYMPYIHAEGASRGYAADPIQYTDRSYQGMSQHEFYTYLTSKSKIVQLLADEATGLSPTTPNFGNGKYINLYHSNENSLSESERIKCVAEALQRDAALPPSNGLSRFLESSEFANMIRNSDALFLKNKSGYIMYDSAQDKPTILDSPQKTCLRPEYAINFAQYDIRTPEGCAKLQKAIVEQLKIDSTINDRPSQELLEMKRFVQDHVAYNEAMQSAEYNSRISRGLNVPSVRYSELTHNILNDAGNESIRTCIQELNRAGITHVDLKAPASVSVVNANYESLLSARIPVEETARKLADTVSETLKHGKVVGNDSEIAANIQNNYSAILNTSSQQDKAELILKTLCIDCDKKLSKSQIMEITKIGTVSEIEKIAKLKNYVDQLETLTSSLRKDLSNGILHSRGCDYMNRNSVGEIKTDNQFDLQAAMKLDISTALAHSDGTIPQSVVNDVLQSQRIRNQIIDSMQDALNNQHKKTNILQNIAGFSERIDDHSLSQKQRADIIADTFGIKFDHDATVANTQRIILNSSEITDQVKKLEQIAKTENFATLSSNYSLALEKMKNVEKFEELVKSLSKEKNIDFSRITDAGYLYYLNNSQHISQSSRDLIAAIQKDDSYTEFVTTVRNIEDLTHRSSLTVFEKDSLQEIGYQAAFKAAFQSDTSAPSINTLSQLKNYNAMVETALDPNQKSLFMQKQTDAEFRAIGSIVHDLSRNLEVALNDQERISNGVVIPVTNSASSHHSFAVQQAMQSKDEMDVLQQRLLHSIESNRFYGDYIKINQNGIVVQKLEEIDRNIQATNSRIKTSEALIADYLDQSKGLFGRKYAKFAAQEERCHEMMQKDIEGLEREKRTLEQSLKATMGTVDLRILDAKIAYDKDHNTDTALRYADKMVSLYGENSIIQNNRLYNRGTTKTEQLIELCENLSNSNIPLSVKKDALELRIEMAQKAQSLCAQEARDICDRQIEKISEEFQGGAKTDITPTIIQAAIDTCKHKLTECPENERSKISFDIERYSDLKARLDNVHSIKNELESSNISQTLVSMSSKLNISTYHISEQYAQASQQIYSATSELNELNKFQSSINAYAETVKLSERTLHLSHAERENAVNYVFEGQQIKSFDQISDKIKSSQLEIADSDEMKAYLDAHKTVHESRSSINILLEKLEDGKRYQDPSSPSFIRLEEQDIKALYAIKNYNNAIDQLRPKAADVRELLQEIAGSKEGANLLAQDMMHQYSRNYIGQYINYYCNNANAESVNTPEFQSQEEQGREVDRSVLGLYSSMSKQEKSELVEKICAMDNDGNVLVTWPSDEYKMGLLTVSEYGLQEAIEMAGGTSSPTSGDIVGYYRDHIKDLHNDRSPESKEIFDRCSELASRVTAEQDDKHEIVMNAIEEAKSSSYDAGNYM